MAAGQPTPPGPPGPRRELPVARALSSAAASAADAFRPGPAARTPGPGLLQRLCRRPFPSGPRLPGRERALATASASESRSSAAAGDASSDGRRLNRRPPTTGPRLALSFVPAVAAPLDPRLAGARAPGLGPVSAASAVDARDFRVSAASAGDAQISFRHAGSCFQRSSLDTV